MGINVLLVLSSCLIVAIRAGELSLNAATTS